jgi:hypothetical protein
VSPPTTGRFSFSNRILCPINRLRYTRQPSCIDRARRTKRCCFRPRSSLGLLPIAAPEPIGRALRLGVAHRLHQPQSRLHHPVIEPIERAPEKPDHRAIDHRCRSSSQIARPRRSSRRPRLPLLATALRRHRWSRPSLSRRPSQQPLKIREALALRPTTSPRSRAWPSGRNRPAGPASPRRRRQPSRSLGPAALRVGPAFNSSTRRLGSALRRVARPCRRRTARPRS